MSDSEHFRILYDRLGNLKAALAITRARLAGLRGLAPPNLQHKLTEIIGAIDGTMRDDEEMRVNR